MIPRAKAFGMQVVGWSRSLTAEVAQELGIEHAASPIEVALPVGRRGDLRR